MKLNLTSGNCFNDILKKKNQELCVPFNEAMMMGQPELPILGASFIAERCATHQVKPQAYKHLNQEFLKLSKTLNKYAEIELWFGRDTFCQINLLTILALLEQEKYQGQVLWTAIDDHTGAVLKAKQPIKLGKYLKLYTKALSLQKPDQVAPLSTLTRALQRYFNLRDPQGTIQRGIQTQLKKGLKSKELYAWVREHTLKDGLGDVQIAALVKQGQARFSK